MNVQSQTILIITLVSICLIGGLGFFSQAFILEGFISLEEDILEEKMEYTLLTIDSERQNLAIIVDNWATWEETHQFIDGNNPTYPETSLSDAVFYYYHLHFIVITGRDGEILFARGFNPDTGEELDLPPSLLTIHEDYITPGADGVSGFTGTEAGHVRIAISPIVQMANGNIGEGDSVEGTVLFARLIDDGWVMRLSDHIGVPAQVSVYSENDMTIREDQLSIVRKNDLILGSRILHDLDGYPLLFLSITQERTIYNKGVFSYQLALIAITGLGILSGTLLYFLINRSYLRRISSLSTKVRNIDVHSSRGEPIDVEGDDEVAELGQSINDMLGAIEADQQVIRESEEHYRLLFNAVDDPMLLVALDDDEKPGVILDSNKAVSGILGISREELIGMRLSRFFSIDDGSQKAFVIGNFYPLNGDPVPVEVSMHTFMYKNRKAAIWVARDISERVKIEKERAASIEQLSQNIEQFAILGDNIRNPLQVIRGGVALLEGQEEYISLIEEQVDQIDERIKQLDEGWLDSENVINFMRRNYK
ncbi:MULTISPECIES: CHASE4 domain-containing protein [Methanocalculus]|uniref:CHASE4 domain-containing protein n=2 Tax=Methanocalculaceae TaxID=1460864 RepID=UPI0020A07927|nr:CHASE4 domain-containing protein [Methanocalculus sp. AMF5]MCP1662811.1 PAS domain S-box-containing protein [Methanocalculus sp. AMF5]